MIAYEQSTQVLTGYYRRAAKLVPIQASGTPEEVLRVLFRL